MGEAAEALVGIEEALDIARDQGVTKLHVVRAVGPDGWRRWTAVVQRGPGGNLAATGHGDSFEDAIVRALMDVGVQW